MLQQYIHIRLVVSTVICVIIRIRMFITLLTTVCHWVPVMSLINPVRIFMPYFAEVPYSSICAQVFQVVLSTEIQPLKICTHFSSPQVSRLLDSRQPQFDTSILNIMTRQFSPPPIPPLLPSAFHVCTLLK